MNSGQVVDAYEGPGSFPDVKKPDKAGGQLGRTRAPAGVSWEVPGTLVIPVEDISALSSLSNSMAPGLLLKVSVWRHLVKS